MSDSDAIFINQKLSIPVSELTFRYSTSSGPGGQHANRAATRVTLLFNVAQSPSLPDDIRARLLTRLATRLDKEGVLQIQAQDSRSQHRNRETAVSRFQTLLASALIKRKKRRPTKPSRAAKERRLNDKKKQSQKKQGRRQQRWD
ncbi:MAG: alternative ribosome rescue aminoacyl-tRNA hydrolase ArfB [Chloroflexota bacterium]